MLIRLVYNKSFWKIKSRAAVNNRSKLFDRI